MNIVFLHSASDLYGSGKILVDVVNIAVNKGNKCWVILPDVGELNECFKELGVPVIISDVGIIRRKYLNLWGMINRLLRIIKSQHILFKLIKKENIDLVYSNTIAVLSGAFISKVLKRRHIWHIHEILLEPKYFVKLMAFLLNKFSSYCIVVSRAVESHWLSLGVSQEKIRLIYNSINVKDFELNGGNLRDELKIPPKTKLVGMIARVHHWKGQDYFLEIAYRLKKEINDIKFVMVGDAFPGYEYLYENINELKNKYYLEESVLDLGFRRDIANILAGLDIFILPSTLPDPLPTTVLEAMAAGKAVVATDHGGATEMVDNNITGLLIPYNNADKACEMILNLLKNKNTVLAMGKEGTERVKRMFSPAVFENNISQLFKEISV